MQFTNRFAALREPVDVLSKVLGIPLLCALPLFALALYLLGGVDLIRFTLSQLTWKALGKIGAGIAGLALVTWARHARWYRDEPPPTWWRRSIWVNLLEIAILIALVFVGIRAIPRFTVPLR